jgi:three-Cys-motif partner protein
MTDHCFGHDKWTESKLNALGDYLVAWRTIFTANAKARHFKTLYIDAFAGTGSRKNPVPSVDPSQPRLFDDNEGLALPDSYRSGSARIALQLESPFDEYIFVEKNPLHAAELKLMIAKDFPALESRCKVWEANGCDVMHELCTYLKDWKHWRAVAFLDPYGMDVESSLLWRIGQTKAIDLWLLFPLGMGVNRLLTAKGLPHKAFAEKLTRVFGDTDWETDFYQTPQTLDLFLDAPAGAEKHTDFTAIGEHYMKRLRGWFADVAPSTKVLKNSKGNPMYLLFFAAANPIGAPTAIKIANYLMAD